MKIGTPELKTKPATKYFDGGYVSFQTVCKELFFEIVRVTKTNQGSLISGNVVDKEHLDNLLKIKNITEAVNL